MLAEVRMQGSSVRNVMVVQPSAAEEMTMNEPGEQKTIEVQWTEAKEQGIDEK